MVGCCSRSSIVILATFGALSALSLFGPLATQDAKACLIQFESAQDEPEPSENAIAVASPIYSPAYMEPIEVSLVVLPSTSSAQSHRLHMSFSADHMLLWVFGISLLGLFVLYRRETDTLTKLRFAAAGGLVSVIFLSTSVALPWTQAPADANAFNLCALGHEAYCVGANAIRTGVADFSATLEQTQQAAAGIRAGQACLLLMFLPACIWLLVAPGSRGAQALVCGSSVPGVFLGISTALFLSALDEGVVRPRGAADIALLTSLTVVVVAISIVALAKRAKTTSGDAPDVPLAVARQAAARRS